jgi:hypothetical protein
MPGLARAALDPDTLRRVGMSHTTEEESPSSLPVSISITRGQGHGVSDDAVCAVPVCPLSAGVLGHHWPSARWVSGTGR